MRFTEQAVYTILHPKLLAELAAGSGDARLRETKRWVTAKKYFDAAQRLGLEMAVIYADAARDCSQLIHWGRLTSLEVDASGTSYTVAGLAPLTGHRTQELILLSTGEQIAPGYIRPYAVVRHPPFVARTAASSPRNPQARAIAAKSEAPESTPTLFSFGYWGAGSATRELVEAFSAAEARRGYQPPLWVDIRISRSVRAAGFRDHAFADLLGANYVWMPDLGNVCVQEGREGFEIRNPDAASDLLRHALDLTNRRVIFFCACEAPIGCHRYIVGRLVKEAADKAGITVNVVEWPGGEPSALTLDVPLAVARAVARGNQKTLPVPPTLSLGEAAAIPWATRAAIRSPEQSVQVLIGPARFSSRGAQFPILPRDCGGPAEFRGKYGYAALR